jgi:hypothetical protein
MSARMTRLVQRINHRIEQRMGIGSKYSNRRRSLVHAVTISSLCYRWVTLRVLNVIPSLVGSTMVQIKFKRKIKGSIPKKAMMPLSERLLCVAVKGT